MNYLPWLAGGAALALAARRGHRKPKGCEVEATDFMVESDWGDPEGGYRIQALCDGQEVGETLVEVHPLNDVVEALSPRCRRNLSAQRRKHNLRTRSVAHTAWTRLNREQQNTGLGTAMYQEASDAAHDLGIPIAPDACFGGGSTSPAAWRVWNRKLAWEGQAARRGRRNVADRKDHIRTYRVGSPKGGAGTFFGSHITDWPNTRHKRWHRDLPLTGVGVLTLPDGDGLARSEGNAQNAPLGARIWHGLLRPVPALRKLAGFDHWCNIDNADAVAAYTLKSRGIDVVHIQNRTTGRTVSVDMRDHTLAELHAHMLREAAKKPKRCASVGAKGQPT